VYVCALPLLLLLLLHLLPSILATAYFPLLHLFSFLLCPSTLSQLIKANAIETGK
jgi:hypothetical protein